MRKSVFPSLLFVYLALLIPERAISGQQRPPASIRNSDPAWSPDGSKIAFMSDRDNDIEIYVMEANGSHQKRLTNAPGRDAHPSWSPDGSKIYFQSPRSDPMPQIYVMNADGSGQKQLTQNAGFSGVPLCSPDGSKILFQVNENPTLEPSHWQIYVMNADGSQQTNLSKNAANDQVPRWSADGRRILFFSDISGKDQLYVMDADGSHRARLTNDAFNNHTGVWSHDGKKIAFTSDRDGAWEIYTSDADGSHVLRLTHNAPGLGLPQWSPDDSHLVFSLPDDENRDIYVMDSNGMQVRRLTCGARECQEFLSNSSALPERKNAEPQQPAIAGVRTGFLTTKDNVRLYYAKVGSGEKTAIIVPGRLFAFRDFQGLAKERTLIFYDMRNRGMSDAVPDPSKISLQHDADDLEAVRMYFGIKKPDLIGFSYLGKIVVLYATQHPDHVDRIVQIGPVARKLETKFPRTLTAGDEDKVPDPAEEKKLDELYKNGFAKEHPQEYCEMEWKIEQQRMVGNPASASRIPSPCEMENEWPIHLFAHFEPLLASDRALEISKESIAKVTAPVLTIHGRKDRNAPYGGGREWAMLLPNARLITIDGAAHMSWVEFPEIVFPSIDVFLNGQWPEQAEIVKSLELPPRMAQLQ